MSFAVIDNSDRHLQLPLMNLIAIFSTLLNLLFVYMLFSAESKQSRIYRLAALIQNGSLWLSQLHWGSLHSLVFLFPFPGLYGVGYLAPFVSSFLLVIIWILLFAVTVLMLFVILLIRLKTIARINGTFHFNKTTYTIFIVLLTLYIFVPIIFCWTSAWSSPTETANFVNLSYPNAVKVLEIPGVFVYTDSFKFHRILMVALLLLVSGGILYVVLCQIIVYEIRQNCRVWSEKVTKYHRKALKDTIVQNMILGMFLAIAPIIQILNAYRDPRVDTIKIDNRTYSSIILTDRNLQIWLTNIGNLLATPINLIAFYLILNNSKREQKLYKFALFMSHFFFYIANLFYGTIANIVILFPFPAVCCIGMLKNNRNGFWIFLFWIFLFACFIFFTFEILVIRLRIVARKGATFHYSDSTYIMFSIFLFIYISVPVSTLWLNAYNPLDEKIRFVEKYFPQNLIASENPSIHVDTGESNQRAIIFLALFMVVSGLTIYSLLYALVIYEIGKQAVFKSAKITMHQKRAVNSALFQIVILGNMVGISILLQIRNAFLDPEIDTRMITALSNTCIVISSIPCQLFMIFRNTSYRRALFGALGSENTTMDKNNIINSVIFVSGRS